MAHASMRAVAITALTAVLAATRITSFVVRAQGAGGLLTIDTVVEIKHPSAASWSPDGARLAFLWDRAGVQNVWLSTTTDGRPGGLRSLTSFDDGLIENLFWGDGGNTLYFTRMGDLWQVPAAGGSGPRPVWTTPAAERDIVPAPDGTRVAFVRSGPLDIPQTHPQTQRSAGDVWVRSLADGSEGRVTGGPAVPAGPVWSPDGARLAFTWTSVVRREQAPDYSGAKVVYTSLERAPSDVAVVSADGGPLTIVAGGPDVEGAPRWLDRSHLLVIRTSRDAKRREILVADAGTGGARLLHRDVDEKWWSLAGNNRPDVAPSPDGRWVAFISDRDGWDHLYLVPTSGDPIVQVTKGQYEVRNLSWSPDSTRIAFDRSQADNPAVRHLAIVTIGAKDPSAIRSLTSGRGTNIDATWSPDGRYVVYQHTDPRNSADLFLTATSDTASGVPARVTDSMPAGVDRAAFVEPLAVQYAAPDGRQVPAYVFVPPGLDRSRRHPAIVWIHGDGVNQHYDGWHMQRNYAVYYSFHQYLVQRGYVVIKPDYRGSIGYGKEWRQGVYLDVGGKDADDAAAAADYLKTLPYVDPDRIGIWGLSYGGFFTVQAMTRRPTLFRCGVNVAGPVDYRMYYNDPYRNAWTVGRMGTPEEHPEVYLLAAPIERIDRLVRPLLVLHGTSDVNVPYIHSVKLVDELLKRHKAVEFMMYPGEFHYFHRGHVLHDAWRRVESFFDTHLRAPSTAPHD
jgi:dipeptidyl aminopeptidase/acylaminoacyl peptidase